MDKKVARGLGLAAGAALGYALIRLFETKTAIIRISRSGDQCTSLTDPYTLPVKRLNKVDWEISDPHGCLGDGSVELRFDREDSPVFERRPRGRRVIKDKVRLLIASGAYHYVVWYVAADGTEYPMEDPELQIEHF